MTQTHTGGCQCGRVRYSFTVAAPEAYLCHCRMCQRATGGFAAAFVAIPRQQFEWVSEPDWYASSPIATRPFCAQCGTPLGFRFNNGIGMDVTVGSLDDPGPFKPTAHYGTEGMHEAWLDTRDLPRHRSDATDSVIKHWKEEGMDVPE